jgi:hypothetical protein
MFCHYAIEFQLENGLVGTLENCVDDVYLYEGTSTRAGKFGVLVADLEILDIYRSVADLVRLRNQYRSVPYIVTKNNCKHFAFEVSKALIGDFCDDGVEINNFNRFSTTCQCKYKSMNEDGSEKNHVIIRNEDCLFTGLDTNFHL